MILQGSNNPLVITFDTSVETIPKLVVSLWSDKIGTNVRPLKMWEKEDMQIDNKTAVCPLTEQETASLPTQKLIVEAKGLDGNGDTVFWQEYPIDVGRRRDKIIRLTQVV